MESAEMKCQPNIWYLCTYLTIDVNELHDNIYIKYAVFQKEWYFDNCINSASLERSF